MYKNVVLLKEDNPVLAFHLQIELELLDYIVIHVQENEDIELLCDLNSPHYLIWGEDEECSQSFHYQQYILSILSFAQTKDKGECQPHSFDQIVFNKPFSNYQLKTFLKQLIT